MPGNEAFGPWRMEACGIRRTACGTRTRKATAAAIDPTATAIAKGNCKDKKVARGAQSSLLPGAQSSLLLGARSSLSPLPALVAASRSPGNQKHGRRRRRCLETKPAGPGVWRRVESAERRVGQGGQPQQRLPQPQQRLPKERFLWRSKQPVCGPRRSKQPFSTSLAALAAACLPFRRS